MDYYKLCLDHLNKIADEKRDADLFIRNMANGCKVAVNSCEKVVFCGAMSYIKGFADYLSDTKECYFFDNCESEGMFLGYPYVSVTDIKYKFGSDTLFIVLSRSNVEFYNFVIGTLLPDAKKLYYAGIEMAYKDLFYIKSREDYSVDGSVAALRYIVDHAKELIGILERFSDDRSREIFSRMILFRLTGNLDLNCNIKSLYDDYLEEDIILFQKHEIVADLGGFIGDTLAEFDSYFKKHGIKYEYHLFEPSKENYLIAKELFDNKKVIFYNACVGDKDQMVGLKSDFGNTVTIDMDAGAFHGTKMVKLDDVLDEVTYIKMDIEGTEELALRGMEGLVKRCHPKLAVCIYHKYDDIVRLVEYVMELTADAHYRYYIRAQRDSVVTELVLYALPAL